MPSNRSTKAKRASASGPTDLRAHAEEIQSSDARDSQTGRTDGTDEATGAAAQRTAIEQAMAGQNVRLTSSPGAVGPIGRTLLLVAILALVGLIAVWLLLAL